MITEEQEQFYLAEARNRAKAKVLREFPDIPNHIDLSKFLAFDPLFSNDAQLLANPNDKDFIALYRKLVLKYLSLICVSYQKRVEDVNQYREMWAKEVWKYVQLMEQLHEQVPREVFDDIDIQAEVLEMDPEFSFHKAVFGEEPEPIPALAHSSIDLQKSQQQS